MAEGGHEHEDAGTVSAFLPGREVLLDPGYAGWSDRAATSGYGEHSGLLVDGAGPSDATLAWAEREGCAAALTAIWSGVAWTRAVAAEAGVVTVSDTVTGGGARELRFQLRSGEGSGVAEVAPWGAVLRYTDAAVVVATTDPVSWGTGTWASSYGVLQAHDRMEVDSDGATLTVLVAGPADWAPAVTVTAEAITVDGRTWTGS